MEIPTTARAVSRGYTLIETLLVIAVVAIMAAILVPILAAERAKGRRNACLVNEHQIGIALSNYVLDYDGTYPPLNGGSDIRPGYSRDMAVWADDLIPYIGRNFPSCPDRALADSLVAEGANSSFSGYAYSLYLTGVHRLPRTKNGREAVVRLGQADNFVLYPSLTISVGEARPGMVAVATADIRDPKELWAAFFPHDLAAVIASQTPGAIRHQGGANYLFVDGHVTWLRPNAILRSDHGDGVHVSYGI